MKRDSTLDTLLELDGETSVLIPTVAGSNLEHVELNKPMKGHMVLIIA